MRQAAATSVFNKRIVLLLIVSFPVCFHVKAQSEWKTNKDGHLKYEYKPGPGYIPPTKSTATSPGTPTAPKTKLQLAEEKYWVTAGFYGNRERVKINLYGFIDRDGVEVIKLIYDDAEDFSEGLAAVKKDGLWGYINEYGSTAIDFKYTSAGSFKGGKAQVTENGVSKEINRIKKVEVEDKTVIAPALVYNEGLAGVQVNGKWGFRNEAGTMIIPAIYDETSPFKRGLGPVKSKGLWGFVDKKGKMVIPAIYLGYIVLDTKEELLVARKKTGSGIINFKGVTVLPFIYSRIYSYTSNFLIRVELKGKFGAVNAAGKVIIPVKYDETFYFHEGYAKVVSNNKHGMIDETGKVVVPLIYDSIQRDANGIFGKLQDKTVEIHLPVIAATK